MEGATPHMPRARRKPALPPQITDTGPDTQAQRLGATYEQTKGGRPGEVIKRREHLLDILARSQPRPPGRFYPPKITMRQRNAGIALFEAWCETENGGSPLKEFVQTSPDWAAIAAANVERVWRFSDVSRYLPQQCRNAVLQVVIHQIPIQAEQIGELRSGLDAIAEGMRL